MCRNTYAVFVLAPAERVNTNLGMDLFEAGSVTKIQAEISKLISSGQNHRSATNEASNLESLLSICPKVLGVGHSEFFRNLLGKRNPRARRVWLANEIRIDAHVATAQQP